MWHLEIAVVLTIVFNLVSGLKVLVFFPYPGKSHTILGEGYVRHLVNAGHDVTYVTPIPLKDSEPNLRQIDVSSNIENFALGKGLDIKKVMHKEIELDDMSLIYKSIHDISEIAVKHDAVQKLLLDTNETFDVAILEWLYTELYAGVPAVFNCPFIWASSIEPHPMILRLIDDIPNPAVIPDHMSPIVPPLNFWQRAGELWNIIKLYYIRWNLRNEETKAWTEAFSPAFAKRGFELPDFDDVKFNASLVLGNSHVSSGQAMTLPQNYIPIAGYHIKEEVPPLPDNLKTILDNAPNGVIYFSLGSMMKGKTMPEELKKGFLKTFSELKQSVIWKFEEQIPNLPNNVHIVEWAPQQSILAHPNTVLFITHGGLLSTTESLHYSVPIIGIPLFADQFMNIKRAVTKGFGKHVELGYDAPIQLKEAIRDVFENPRYRENVKELSLVYHDRPVTPGAELVHWVEHVAKTRGARHLRSPALLLPWYQKAYLDLALVITVCLFIIVKVIKLSVGTKTVASNKKNN